VRERIELGLASERVYARLPERELVLEVPRRLYDAVPRDLFGYRFKQVLEVDREAVKRVELDFPREGTKVALRAEGGRWRAEDPSLEVESLRIDDLLWALQDLDAMGIEETSFEPARLGFEPPTVRVVLRGEGGAELAWLELGQADGSGGIPARSSQGDAVWRLDPEIGRSVPLGLAAFRERWLAREEPEPAPTGATGPTPPGG
jgi:hypothetical protein